MSAKKLARTTKRIEKWRVSYDPSRVENTIAGCLAKLETPEASWALQDLIDSGADFSRLDPVSQRTYQVMPENSMLVGYHTYIVLRGNYHIMAVCRQLVQRDPRGCKEALYCAAWSQWALCRWPDETRYNSFAILNGPAMLSFHAAVMADVDMEFLKEFGDLLRRPEYQTNFRIPFLEAMLSEDRAYIALALGEDEAVIRAQVEKALADLEGLKGARKSAITQPRILLDILDGDESALDQDLRDAIRYARASRENSKFMYWDIISYAKTAMRRGMRVEVDTEDCPLSLSRPEKMDYSGLKLPRPKYGFPWEL